MTRAITPESVAQMIVVLNASDMMQPISNRAAWDAAKMLADMQARITALEGFVADFAGADFPAIRAAGMYHPEDEPDDVTELAPIEAWQEDARALIAPQPAMQEAAE